jgi:hypothetical protein
MGTSFSKPPYPPEKTPPEKTPEEKERINKQNEFDKKMYTLVDNILFEIRANSSNPEYVIKLPIKKIHPKNASPDYNGIFVNTYLLFKKCPTVINDINPDKCDYMPNLYTLHFIIEEDPYKTIIEGHGIKATKKLFDKEYFGGCYMKDPYLNVSQENSRIYMKRFLEDIYDSLSNLYMETYQENLYTKSKWYNTDDKNTFSAMTNVFESVEGVELEKCNKCKQCDGYTKNILICYFCSLRPLKPFEKDDELKNNTYNTDDLEYKPYIEDVIKIDLQK